MKVIGMMSGTSADGIDAVVVELNGQPPALSWQLIKHIHLPFSETVQQKIFSCFSPKTSSVDLLCALNFELGQEYGRAALEVVKQSSLTPADVELIGNHGQTVWHIPSGPSASTLQIGEAALIAEITGITTISNFRARDMAAGGQGAPLVSYIDTLLFTHPNHNRVLQNIGGIANGTYLPDAHELSNGRQAFAFDTGPGNMLIDDAVRRITNGALQFDDRGAMAAKGQINQQILSGWISAEPYFRLPPPKTTGRELFGSQYGERLWRDAKAQGMEDHDYLATVTAFTARSIGDAYRQYFPKMPEEVIVSGGGAYNPTLLKMLQDEIAPGKVEVIDRLGMPSDAKEAVAFAVLAYETWHNRPGNLPPATGARQPVVLGCITPGKSFKNQE